jgi:hypothetical protein
MKDDSAVQRTYSRISPHHPPKKTQIARGDHESLESHEWEIGDEFVVRDWLRRLEWGQRWTARRYSRLMRQSRLWKRPCHPPLNEANRT